MRNLVLAGGLSATALLIASATACRSGAALLPDEARASHVTPIFVSGNPTCADYFEDACELKVEPVADGTYSVTCGSGPDAFSGTVTVDVTGSTFDWSSEDILIEGVVVKGGPNANLYVYDPPADEDDDLHAPINPSNGRPYGLSHISFCAVEAPPEGALVIQKTRKDASATGGTGASAQSGVSFNVYDAEANLVATVQTDADGEACVDGLLVDDGPYTVEEVVPEGYADVASQSNVEIVGDTTCQDVVGASSVSFENTPLSQITVTFESLAEGENGDATKARIVCYDEDGNELTPVVPEGGDTDEPDFNAGTEVYTDLPPNTDPSVDYYDCRIYIDP